METFRNTSSHKPRAADADVEHRPGVPRLKSPPSVMPGALVHMPVQPLTRRRPTQRMELRALTPVFGTAQLPRGLSGLVRRIAYRIPEHRARHWLLLLLADRVEATGHRVARLAARGVAAVALFGAGVFAAKRIRHA